MVDVLDLEGFDSLDFCMVSDVQKVFVELADAGALVNNSDKHLRRICQRDPLTEKFS